MASYATPTDLLRYITAAQLTGISAEKQQEALDEASGEANGSLKCQFTLPLSAPYPIDLVRHVCAIAIWNLLCFKGFNPEQGSNATIATNYEKALAWLRAVARREIEPDGIIDASPLLAKGGPRVWSRTPRC